MVCIDDDGGEEEREKLIYLLWGHMWKHVILAHVRGFNTGINTLPKMGFDPGPLYVFVVEGSMESW